MLPLLKETKDTAGVYGLESFHECLIADSSKVTSLWILAEEGTVMRPPGVVLEGGPTALQETYLNNTLGFP